MALKSSLEPKRLDIPDEPGKWIEYKPISAGEFIALLEANHTGPAYAMALIQLVLTGWNYDAPLSPESVSDLTADTFKWLDANVMEWAGLRSPEQKNGSTEPSSPISEPATESSPPSSDT